MPDEGEGTTIRFEIPDDPGARQSSSVEGFQERPTVPGFRPVMGRERAEEIWWKRAFNSIREAQDQLKKGYTHDVPARLAGQLLSQVSGALQQRFERSVEDPEADLSSSAYLQDMLANVKRLATGDADEPDQLANLVKRLSRTEGAPEQMFDVLRQALGVSAGDYKPTMPEDKEETNTDPPTDETLNRIAEAVDRGGGGRGGGSGRTRSDEAGGAGGAGGGGGFGSAMGAFGFGGRALPGVAGSAALGAAALIVLPLIGLIKDGLREISKAGSPAWTTFQESIQRMQLDERNPLGFWNARRRSRSWGEFLDIDNWGALEQMMTWSDAIPGMKFGRFGPVARAWRGLSDWMGDRGQSDADIYASTTLGPMGAILLRELQKAGYGRPGTGKDRANPDHMIRYLKEQTHSAYLEEERNKQQQGKRREAEEWEREQQKLEEERRDRRQERFGPRIDERDLIDDDDGEEDFVAVIKEIEEETGSKGLDAAPIFMSSWTDHVV